MHLFASYLVLPVKKGRSRLGVIQPTAKPLATYLDTLLLLMISSVVGGIQFVLSGCYQRH